MQLVHSDDINLTLTADNWIFGLDLDPDQIEKNLVETMIASNGIGLAANQVGILKRVFSIKLQNHSDIKTPLAMFNPSVISQSSDEELGEEGCLSFPDLYLYVKRPKTIEAEYFDKSGKQCIITLSGIDARCFLHELDHLNGVCFTDKVSKLKLELALKKQRKLNGRTKR